MLGSDKVQAALQDLSRADLPAPLRATLAMLAKVTRDHASVTAADMRALYALGLTRKHVEDALDVAFAFNVITRLADAFLFHVGPPSFFDAGAKMLLTRGYK